MPASAPKILILDIETSPIEAYVWGLRDQYITPEQVKVEWSIMAYCAKWYGARELFYADTSTQRSVRDDSGLLKKLWQLLDDADIVVAQNGASFDLKKINARLVEAGHRPYSPVKVVDTLRVARKHFGFTSNKLAWQAQHLTKQTKLTHNKFPGLELWKQCLAGNREAWSEMRRYNQQDVLACEAVYKAQLAWMDNHPDVNVYANKKAPRGAHLCPNCGSSHTQRRGYSVARSIKYARYQCQKCGTWSKGKEKVA